MKEMVIALLCATAVLISAIAFSSSICNNDEYARYKQKILNENYSKGTYELAVSVFERELVNPNNEVSFVYNEFSIKNERGSTNIFSFKIKVDNVYMLLNQKDYFKYKEYVLKRSKEHSVGKEVKVDWSK